MYPFNSTVGLVEFYIDELPSHPDKLLFAQDFVNYMNDSLGIDYRLNRAECFRQITYNAFNETVKAGINHMQSYYELPSNVDKISTWDKDTYFYLACEMRKNQFDEGLEMVQFLYFCLNVTHLARVFLSNGLSDAPKLAMVAIYVTLLNYDMMSGGWDNLNLAVKKLMEGNDSENPAMIDSAADTSTTDTSDNEARQRTRSSSSGTSSDNPQLNSGNSANSSSVGNGDENVPQACAIANGGPLQHSYEIKRVVEGKGRSTNGERHGANMNAIPSTSIGVNIFSEYLHMRALAFKRRLEEEGRK